MRASAMNEVRTANDVLLHALNSFDQGSKEMQAILRAITALNTIGGKATGANMVPAGIAAMAQASNRGPPTTAPPPGVAGGGAPPGMPGMPLPEAEAA